MSLIKGFIHNQEDKKYYSYNIKSFLTKNPLFTGLIYEDYNKKIHVKKRKYVPFYFCNQIVFISTCSFQQNNQSISDKIRYYTMNNIKNIDRMICVGGESYIYGLLSHVKTIIHYSNSTSIIEDSNYNHTFYRKSMKSYLIDYNKNEEYDLNIHKDIYYCVINLSKLNKTLLLKVNHHYFRKIIIIHCNHTDFWKKIKYLSNYQLIDRKKFIDKHLGYFISVNIFIHKKRFISLGSTCSVAWNLNRFKLRTCSMPFDWVSSKVNQIIHVLKHNFEDYEDVKIKKFSVNHLDFNNDKGTFILHNKYNITFAHEVIDHKNINEFTNKMATRIETFKRIENPTFVFLETSIVNKNKYIELIYSLKKYFHVFECILISKINPQINEIKHVYLNVDFIDWKYDHFNWKNVFMY